MSSRHLAQQERNAGFCANLFGCLPCNKPKTKSQAKKACHKKRSSTELDSNDEDQIQEVIEHRKAIRIEKLQEKINKRRNMVVRDESVVDSSSSESDLHKSFGESSITIQEEGQKYSSVEGLIPTISSDSSSSFRSSFQVLNESGSLHPGEYISNKQHSSPIFTTPINNQKDDSNPSNNAGAIAFNTKGRANGMFNESLKSPMVGNVPKYYERKMNKGKPRFKESSNDRERIMQLIEKDGRKIRNPFDKSFSRNDEESLKVPHPMMKPNQRTQSIFTNNMNPMDSGVNPTSNRHLPRIMSPIERNREENKPKLNLKGYSRKRMIIHRNILTSD